MHNSRELEETLLVLSLFPPAQVHRTERHLHCSSKAPSSFNISTTPRVDSFQLKESRSPKAGLLSDADLYPVFVSFLCGDTPVTVLLQPQSMYILQTIPSAMFSGVACCKLIIILRCVERSIVYCKGNCVIYELK